MRCNVIYFVLLNEGLTELLARCRVLEICFSNSKNGLYHLVFFGLYHSSLSQREDHDGRALINHFCPPLHRVLKRVAYCLLSSAMDLFSKRMPDHDLQHLPEYSIAEKCFDI